MPEIVKTIRNKLQENLTGREEIFAEEIKKGNIDNVRFILTENPELLDSNSASGATPLLYAIQNGNLQIVELLLSKGADANKRSSTGASPILFACQKGRLSIVTALIEKGANICERHIQNGSTPLIIASQHGHFDIVKYLVEKGASVNKANNHGVTPMHVAVKNEHNSIVIFLIEHGARRRKTTQSGLSPVKIAEEKKNYVLSGLLHKWKFMENNPGKKRDKVPAGILTKNNNPYSFMEGI